MAQLLDSECWSTGIVFNLSCPRRAAFHCVPLKGDSRAVGPHKKPGIKCSLSVEYDPSSLQCLPSLILALSLKRMVLVNCPTKIASLLPHISPMHPKAMLSKMGISMMYAAQKARNIGSVVLSLLSRTHTCCASESFVVLSVRLYVIYIRPFCVQTAAEGGSRSNPFRSPRSGGSLRVSPEPSSFPGSRRNLPACPSRSASSILPSASILFPLRRPPACPITRRGRRRCPPRRPPLIWSPNSPSVPTSVSVRSSFRSLFPSPSVRQNGSDVVVFHIKENLSDVAAVLFCKTGMGEEREKGDHSLARKAGGRTHEIAAITVG